MSKVVYDAACANVAQITADGRLKIWDVASGKATQEFTPPSHLASELTAVKWGVTSVSLSESKTKKSKKLTELVAIGTAQGHIMLWDCAKGEVSKVLGGADASHTASVSDLSFNESGSSLYSCSEDCMITSWSVSTGAVQWQVKAGKQPCRRLAHHPHGDILAAGGTSIKLWDLSTRTTRRKYAGHASPVSCLAFSPAGRFLLSAAADRFLSLWDATDDAAADNSQALMVFTLDSAPTQLSFAAPAGESDDARLQFLAVAESGTVGLWQVESPGRKARKRAAAGAGEAAAAAATPLPPQCTLGSSKKAARVAAARFPAGGADHAALCVGSHVLPTFQRVKVLREDGTLAADAGAAAEAHGAADGGGGGLLLEAAARRKKAAADEHMVDVVGVADMPLPNGMGGKEGKKGADAAKRKGKEEADKEGEDAGSLDGDETLEDKIRALGLAGDDSELALGSAAASGKGKKGRKEGPKAGSVQSLLQQALASDDKILLEKCFNVQNHRTIEETVARLPPASVLQLLNKVVAKFQARPARSAVLVHWIRSVLIFHTSFLMSQPDVVGVLTPLYRMVESRVATYHKLLKLEGRLDLALSQVSGRSAGNHGRGSHGGEVTAANLEPDLVVRDRGADDSDNSPRAGPGDGEDDEDDDGETETEEEDEEMEDADEANEYQHVMDDEGNEEMEDADGANEYQHVMDDDGESDEDDEEGDDEEGEEEEDED